MAGVHQAIPFLFGTKKRKRTQQEEDDLHCIPSMAMGDYSNRQVTLTRSLRDPLEDEQEAILKEKAWFGNPYKRDKAKNESLSEAEEEASQFGDVPTDQKTQKRKGWRLINAPRLCNRTILMPNFVQLTWTETKQVFEEAMQTHHQIQPPSDRQARPIIFHPPIEEPERKTIVDESHIDVHMPEMVASEDEASEALAPESPSTDGQMMLVDDEPLELPTQPNETDWRLLRKQLYRELYQWPKDYKPEVLKRILPRDPAQLEWIKKHADGLGRDI